MEAAGFLGSASETPLLDAQTLLAHVCGKNRTWVLAHPEARLTAEQETAWAKALRRLGEGEPLPYVLGEWEFYGLAFQVTRDVLIPRPETELLVERALAWLRANPKRRRAVDVGTGSGCIAIALAAHVGNLRLIASDLSLDALRVAQRNAQRHHLAGKINFVQCDLLSPLPMDKDTHSIDLLCANLPYIPHDTLKNLPIFGQEPRLALDGGKDGLDHIRRLLSQASQRLARGGLALLEIEARQGEAVLELARGVFPLAEICLQRDLAGHERLIGITYPD
ncbi:MAG: peptide chain release factor N(5)-glutamine methyltransferase [Anaerolineales bacterium]|nr:peptide chain release factor N(5)-glutamine methyltransferase [Anaerolineales bacterium]